jgi:hypothetical protein
MEIENVLIRLREATTAINRAADDPRMKAIMEKSWLLQDRLAIPEMVRLIIPSPFISTDCKPSLKPAQRTPFVLSDIYISVECFTFAGRPETVSMGSI